MERSTAPDRSPLIPTVIPQAPDRSSSTSTQTGVQLVGLSNRTWHVGGNITLTRARLSRQSRERLDQHAHLRAEAMRELGLMAPPNTCPLPDRERLAIVIANKVMQRVPLGTPAPLELRVIDVKPAAGMLAGSRTGGVYFNVVAWGPEAPPPTRPVNSSSAEGWYPHDPLGHGGTELDLRFAPIQVSGQLLLRGAAPVASVRPTTVRARATASADAPGFPARPGCAPGPSRPPR